MGNIVTLDLRNATLRALTVKDGLIQYVGTEEMARKLCDENTEVIDFGDNYIYPGFMDAHCHGSLAGPRLAYLANLQVGNNYEDYFAIMKDFMAKNPDNESYLGAGWMVFGSEPNAAMLDEICPDKPMVLNSSDGHTIWVNTLAMKKFGIDKEFAKKWGPGMVHVYEDGTPTGYVSEAPGMAIMQQAMEFTKEELKAALLKWQDFALSLGFTGYYEAGANEKLLNLYDELDKEGKWKLRTYCGYIMNELSDDYIADVHKAKEMAEKYNSEHLKVIGVKLFMDGVLEAKTAWLLEDYENDPGNTGVKRFCDHDRVVELYKECAKLGLNVHQHCIGDGAVHFALDCMEEAQTETGNMDMRNCIAHLQMVSPEDVKRLTELNCIAVVAPLWMFRDDNGFYQNTVNLIGDKRTFYCYPMNSFVRNYGSLAFHSDYPVSQSVSVPNSVYMACKRANPHLGAYYQWNPDECITREYALAGLTMGPAYSFKQEEHLGSLMIGYVANMAVFDSDFLNDDLEKVADSKVVATIVDGEVVYRA
ncbi:MAG: amidohydrolase [Eubacteriales bacterium]|nr:amidohydrolase [Eubacteriales bacterium]